MSLNPNAALVARRLKEAGYTRGQIAGVLGNIQLESGFNPRINEGGTVGAPLGKGGFGFAQWTGGRQQNLVNFAKQKKMDPGDPNLQADFLLYELRGPEKRADQSLRGAVSPEESARRFLVDFERAGVPKTKQRQEAARRLYGQLQFLDEPSAPPAPGTGTAQTPVDKGNNLGANLLRSVMGIIPQLQRKRSFLPELQTPDYLGLTAGTSFASDYLQNVARQMMEEV
jgi:hypothetical protein